MSHRTLRFDSVLPSIELLEELPLFVPSEQGEGEDSLFLSSDEPSCEQESPFGVFASLLLSSPNDPSSMKILSRRDEGNGYVTLRLKRPNGWAFEPGQYVEVRAMPGAKPLFLAIASGKNDCYIEVTGRASDDPSHSGYALFKDAGESLLISAPQGTFFPLTNIHPKTPLLVLGGGSGITALRSVLRSSPRRNAHLVYTHRTACDLMYKDEIVKWQAKGHQINLTREAHPDFGAGRIQDSIVQPIAPDTVAFICGPESLVKETVQFLVSLGVPRENIYGSLPKGAADGGPVFRGDHPLFLS